MEKRVQGAVALGANLGNPRDTLRAARCALEDRLTQWGCGEIRFSGLWETEPVGPPQPRYLNAACTFSAPATLEPQELLGWLLALESTHGRVRTTRLGPRTLDLDLLYLGDTQLHTAQLELPHPRAHERAFVLWPLADANPHAVLPTRGAVIDLARRLGRDGVAPLTTRDDPW